MGVEGRISRKLFYNNNSLDDVSSKLIKEAEGLGIQLCDWHVPILLFYALSNGVISLLIAPMVGKIAFS